MSVLFENKTKEKNKYFGRDEYFNSVIVESDESLTGKIKKVIIEYNKKILKVYSERKYFQRFNDRLIINKSLVEQRLFQLQCLDLTNL